MGLLINSSLGLKLLDLSWCKINADDFIDLLRIIEGNKTLRDVKFANLSCGVSDTEQIAESLHNLIKKNKSLLHLDISHLPLKAENILKICEACNKARTLVSIHLTNPTIDTKELKMEIRKIMRPRKRLKDHQDCIEEPDSED